MLRCTTCSPHAAKKCCAGDPWHYDSCGKREAKADDCSSSEACLDGACVSQKADLVPITGKVSVWGFSLGQCVAYSCANKDANTEAATSEGHMIQVKNQGNTDAAPYKVGLGVKRESDGALFIM